ncbi:hypothetical protein HOLleu_21353 [Holothuria leucospilota]|uniref:Integrase catalytic domain-containing protein n=1 Tax=Holothuria leucospilota TaxID=206669 RepID=A0A9Q1BXT1_HOLLE|nr:hypothetical protein HOLleu_21353 [Holothuria leucospilota]
MTMEEIDKCSRNDPESQELRNCIDTGKWVGCNKSYYAVRHELTKFGNMVLRGTRIVMPRPLREQTLKLAHEGHQGIVKTKQRLRQKVWWPNIDREVEGMIRQCHACQVVNKAAQAEPIQPSKLPEGPWEDLAVDLCGPFPSGEYIIVLTDYYSRWPEATVLHSITSQTIINWLNHVFSSHGYPKSITCDNGAQFVSKEFCTYLSDHGIHHRRVTPYWPQANGQVERMNKVFLKLIRASVVEGKDWRKELTNFLLIYRSSPHITTGLSPAEMLFKRQIRTKLPQVGKMSVSQKQLKEAIRHDRAQKQSYKNYADRHRRTQVRDIKPGDKVLVKCEKKNILSPAFYPTPFKVVKKMGNCLELMRPDGIKFRRNVSHTKLYKGGEGEIGDANLYDLEEDDICDNGEGENIPNHQRENDRPRRNRHPPRWLDDYIT